MRVVIAIDCDNAAFEGPDWGPEVARLLHYAAGQFEHDSAPDQLDDLPSFILQDINGNKCGKVEVTE